MRPVQFLVFILMSLVISACGDNYAGNSPEGSGFSESASTVSTRVAATGYVRYRTGFSLYLSNTSSTKSIEVTGASFKENADGAFELYKWKNCNDDAVTSTVFTEAVIPPGCTITFTILFYPTQVKEHTAIFEVFYANKGGGSLTYGITGSVLSGVPPDEAVLGGTGNGSGEGSGSGSGNGSGGSGDGSGGNTDSDGPSNTPAAELSGTKLIHVTHLYSYMSLYSGPTPVSSATDTHASISLTDAAITLEKIVKTDEFIIVTDPAGSFAGAELFVITDADTSGSFDSATTDITIEDVPIRLRGEGLTTVVADPSGVFEAAFDITLTSGEVAMPSIFNSTDLQAIQDTFKDGTTSETSITGIAPSDASTRTILLVGCGLIYKTDIITSETALSIAFKDDQYDICVELEGVVVDDD